MGPAFGPAPFASRMGDTPAVRRRLAATTLAIALVAAACVPAGSTSTTADPAAVIDRGLVDVAAQLCPMLWRFQLDVGRIANQMSSSTLDEPDPEVRQAAFAAALGGIRARLDTLAVEVSGLTPGPYSGLLVADVLEGLAQSGDVLAELEEFTAQLDGPPRSVMPSMFHQIEKVIDVAKPELAAYRDPVMIEAFRTIPQCQHGVKDVDDGVPRFVPEE